MRKLFLFITLVGLVPFLSVAQVGKPFPVLSGTTLDNKNITLPTSTKGKYTVLGIGYSQKSKQELETWLQPAFSTFIHEPEYEAQVYFVIMIGGIKQAAGDKIEEKLKKELDPELHKYVLVYQGALGKYKDDLNMTEKETPYFYVLDPQGKIIYTTSGVYTKGKMDGATKLLPEAKGSDKDDDDDDDDKD
jgi:16S rRNA G1207 methylase RsmC